MATNGAHATQSDGFPHAATPDLNIVIIGASLSGLAAALALKRLPQPHAHNITLLERNPSPCLQDHGAGIDAGGDTLAFFQRYDKSRQKLAVSSLRRQYLDSAGKVVHSDDLQQNMTSWDLVYHVLRANVDGYASAYCDVPADDDNGRVRLLHGHRVTGLWEKEGSVVVDYATSKLNKGSITADLVIGADGPSSTIRNIFAPSVARTYAGYVALRGTVREDAVSAATRATFSERFTFFHERGIQIIAYLIPGADGTLEPGKRLINYTYYTNLHSKSPTDRSPEFRALMTDIDGAYHRIALPPGKMNPQQWSKQCADARAKLPPTFAELVCATESPFAQAVTDVLAPTNEFLDGRVLLLGDALAGFRPHAVASASQACFHAMMLADMIEGRVARAEWKRQTLGFARTLQARAVKIGVRTQIWDLPLHEHIQDRDRATRHRHKEVWPEWAVMDDFVAGAED